MAKKKKVAETMTNEQAQAEINAGSAEIPASAVIPAPESKSSDFDSAFAKHPKFAKFKSVGEN